MQALTAEHLEEVFNTWLCGPRYSDRTERRCLRRWDRRKPETDSWAKCNPDLVGSGRFERGL